MVRQLKFTVPGIQMNCLVDLLTRNHIVSLCLKWYKILYFWLFRDVTHPMLSSPILLGHSVQHGESEKKENWWIEIIPVLLILVTAPCTLYTFILIPHCVEASSNLVSEWTTTATPSSPWRIPLIFIWSRFQSKRTTHPLTTSGLSRAPDTCILNH